MGGADHSCHYVFTVVLKQSHNTQSPYWRDRVAAGGGGGGGGGGVYVTSDWDWRGLGVLGRLYHNHGLPWKKKKRNMTAAR